MTLHSNAGPGGRQSSSLRQSKTGKTSDSSGGCDFRCCLHHENNFPGEKLTESSMQNSPFFLFLWITVINTAGTDMIIKDIKSEEC